MFRRGFRKVRAMPSLWQLLQRPFRRAVNACRAAFSVIGLARRNPRKNRDPLEVKSLAKEPKRTADIIGMSEIPVPAENGKTEIQVWVTYRYGTLSPGTVRIPKKEYTDDKVAQLIAQDVQRRLEEKPKKLEF